MYFHRHSFGYEVIDLKDAATATLAEYPDFTSVPFLPRSP